jgi:hypothetical protein
LITDCFSLQAKRFSTTPDSLIVLKDLVVDDENITHLVLGQRSLQVYGSALMPVMSQGANANFLVSTSSDDITLSIAEDVGTEILRNFKLNCTNPNATTLHLDETWNRVTNADGVTIAVLEGSIKLVTDLVVMPNINVVDADGTPINCEKEPKTPVFTSDLAFYIFVGILGAIALLSIILCFIGDHCAPAEPPPTRDADDESTQTGDKTKTSDQEEKTDKKKPDKTDQPSSPKTPAGKK